MSSIKSHSPTSDQPQATRSYISDFMKLHFRHFNARELVAAAEAYKSHLDAGGKMLMATRRCDEYR